MQINSISNYYQPNFNGISRCKLNNGSTAVITVITNAKGNIDSLSCNLWKKGKVLKKLDLSWKNGITLEKILPALNRIAKSLNISKEEAEEGISDSIFDAYLKDINWHTENF